MAKFEKWEIELGPRMHDFLIGILITIIWGLLIYLVSNIINVIQTLI